MGNYNPRQNTRMRWKDVRELEKFIFISGAFEFQNKTLEHVSQDKLYSKIIEVLNSNRPVLIYDTINQELSIGNTDSNHNMYITTLYTNSSITYTLDYDKETDKLRIEVSEENFISDDNVKTIFGQDIFGRGDINLYRHQIFLTSNTTVVIIEILSSNNLKVDSAQDLTTLTNAYAGMKFIGLDSNTNKTYVVSYNGALWRMYDGSAYYDPNSFSDTVAPI